MNRVPQEWMFGVLDILIFEEKKSLYKYILIYIYIYILELAN